MAVQGANHHSRLASHSISSRSTAVWDRNVAGAALVYWSAAEPTVACLVGADGSQEINSSKGRPQHVGKVKLAVHTLPKQKARQTDLATGSNDQVWVRQVSCIEMASNCLRCDAFDQIGARHAPLRLRFEEITDSIDDLLAAAIRYCDC